MRKERRNRILTKLIVFTVIYRQHCITEWECELKPATRENTLKSLASTLNKIFLLDFSTQAQGDNLQDHSIRNYEIPEEVPMMAAEEILDNYYK